MVNIKGPTLSAALVVHEQQAFRKHQSRNEDMIISVDLLSGSEREGPKGSPSGRG